MSNYLDTLKKEDEEGIKKLLDYMSSISNDPFYRVNLPDNLTENTMKTEKITKEEQRIFESALIVVASAIGAGIITLIAIIFSKI
jgi:ribosomal 50S subunit-associated protein YjgA (DUF615 family)